MDGAASFLFIAVLRSGRYARNMLVLPQTPPSNPTGANTSTVQPALGHGHAVLQVTF